MLLLRVVDRCIPFWGEAPLELRRRLASGEYAPGPAACFCICTWQNMAMSWQFHTSLYTFSTNGCQGDRALKVLSSTQAKSYHRQALNHCPSWRRSLFMSIPGGLSGLSCHLSQLKASHFLHRQNSHMYSHVSASIVTLLSKAGRSLGSSIEARWI